MIPTLFICILAISSSAQATPTFPQKQAERLIRGLNLFPKVDVNIVQDDRPASATDAPLLVEKPFRFPFLDANSSAVTAEDLGHHAGYYRLPHTKGASMFYFFFESRTKNASAPVVIWLTGGPGCSSSLALFFENGPFHMNKEDSSLMWNDFGWDQASNLIYIDQPTGTGFSFTTDTDDLRHSTAAAGVDFYDFLQAFFGKHPELVNNDFYITGESYAGHYIPEFASQIQQNNKEGKGIHINLKGIAIGNGLTDTAIQYVAYPDYALDMKLIDRDQYDSLNGTVSTCLDQIKDCEANNPDSCSIAYQTCNTIFNEIIDSKPGINYYDIRKECIGSLCYNFSSAEIFLNEKEVQKALGVNDIYFVSCSSVVYDFMIGDWVKNFEVGLPSLLEDGIKILIYAGEYDLICNWLGNSRWVESMTWSGQKQFVAAPSVTFKVDGADAGLRKSYGGLSFLKVYNAGHMVPMDQPKASLEMLRRWMEGQPL